MDGMMNGMMGDGANGAGDGLTGTLGGIQMFLMGIVPLLLIGLVVWLIVEGVRRNDATRQSSTSLLAPYLGANDRTPRSILDERYAAGEIDRDEYLQRRVDLGK